MSDMDEAEGEPNEFLEAEKKKDPQEWAEQYMRRAEALVAAGEKARQARSEDVYLTGSPAVPRTLVFNVRKIDNGFILVTGSEGLHGHYSAPIQEKYFATPEELVKGAAQAVEAFVKGVPA